jgi:hypothetical protein
MIMYTGFLTLALASFVAMGVNAQFSDDDIKCADSTIDTVCEPSQNDACAPSTMRFPDIS